MAQAYQPMFRLVAEKILAPGIAQGLFRNVGLNSTASLLMTVYLGTSSQVDQNGKAFMDPRQVGEFILRGLLADRSG
jgi:hypothetical protein